ncbi:ribosome biogenesis GTPase Der [Buchnera aphidicola]|uniref:GTPase Der n=1 Tax=Buchnera aphidicola subsp. Cinara cedri (strain Cc) TaxID=372461 RepID=Q056V7_BUCCC|nr:ribosome biogenesis GTPase Der [Buchnera aphidicola]ABJ90842.1 GTP-binding protein [Buchnera aphidicola BCc]
MILNIALIGKSNVGKSSLFNLLTNSKSALTSDLPSTTRDRQYGFLKIKEKKINIIDTAGINNIKRKFFNLIEKQAYKQTILAIQEFHLIFFLVDARYELTIVDYFILKLIRKENKNIFLLINKIDLMKRENSFIDFYNLGIKNIFKISVIHKIGYLNLLKNIYNFLKKREKKIFLENNKINKYINIKICFLGKTNAGKSTLINSLLNSNRVITSSTKNTTRDMIEISLINKKIKYIFTDTAGINKKRKKKDFLNYIFEKKSFDVVKKNQIAIIVIDSYVGISSKDLSIITFLINQNVAFFIIFNKWDLISKERKKKIKQENKYRLKFIRNIKIIYLSAIKKTNLKKIFLQIKIIYNESKKIFSTSSLIKIINKATKKHSLPMGVTGKIIKLKYAHLGRKNPIFIIIHGTQVQYISQTYKKYLIRFLQKELKIPNTPIKLFFKNKKNPYT